MKKKTTSQLRKNEAPTKSEEKFSRVFQVGFDIAETAGVSNDERKHLCVEISNLIDNYYDITGSKLNFRCVNEMFRIEDMSEYYDESIMKDINAISYNRK